MSVALVSMESAYGLRLGGLASHHHHLHHPLLHHHHHHRTCSPPMAESHVISRQQIHRDERSESESTALRFSVVNILRPDFGKEAILNTKSSSTKSTTIVKPIAHSPIPLPRDLSLSSSRLSSPQSPPSTTTTTTTTNFSQRDRDSSFSSHCGLTSPLQRHSGLSRSGSLESLASNRSSVTGSSVTGAPSLCSTSSTISGESISGESNNGNAASTGTGSTSTNGGNGQSVWPAWIYCTRYSDRPSSGELNFTFH